MLAIMAWTTQDVELLEEALKGGELTVRLSNGQLTTYQSTDEMLRLRAAMLKEIQSTSRASGTGIRYKTAIFSDG